MLAASRRNPLEVASSTAVFGSHLNSPGPYFQPGTPVQDASTARSENTMHDLLREAVADSYGHCKLHLCHSSPGGPGTTERGRRKQ